MSTYDVTSTFTAGAKPPVVRSWDNLDRGQVTDQVEAVLINVLQRLNHSASDTGNKRAASVPNTNPVLVKYSLVITEDGKPWSNSAFEWYGLGDERQAYMLSLLNVGISTFRNDVTAKEKKHGGGKKP